MVVITGYYTNRTRPVKTETMARRIVVLFAATSDCLTVIQQRMEELQTVVSPWLGLISVAYWWSMPDDRLHLNPPQVIWQIPICLQSTQSNLDWLSLSVSIEPTSVSLGVDLVKLALLIVSISTGETNVCLLHNWRLSCSIYIQMYHSSQLVDIPGFFICVSSLFYNAALSQTLVTIVVPCMLFTT